MPRRRNPSDDEIKLLVKLSKKIKGQINLDLAKRVFAEIGWSIVDTVTALDTSKKRYEVDDMLERELVLDPISSDEYENRISVSYDSYTPKAWNFQTRTRQRTEELLGKLLKHSEVVTAAPKDPLVNHLYVTKPSAITVEQGWYAFSVKKMWLGAPGWIVTTPKGEVVEIPAPLTRRGFDVQPDQNLAALWTFIYKHGIDKDAKHYLDAIGDTTVAKATASKAERARIEMARSALPEIADVFRQITDARYQSVVRAVESYLHQGIAQALKTQRNQERINWMEIPFGSVVHQLMTTEYDPSVRGGYAYKPRDGYERMLHAEAVRIADESREAFVLKNTARISEISKRKGSIPSAKLLDINDEGLGGYGGEIAFAFPDGSSFILRNKTVWKTSSGGVTFAQFPTTFHDVVLPGGKKMASPSEARMLDVFARATEQNFRGRPSSHERALASRLARA